jgi:ABC-type phosphate transport system substrate-binding protein
MCLAICPCLQAKQLAVVTNKASSITNLTGAEFSKIINLKSHAWPDGSPLIVVTRDPSTPEMELLLHRVLNMTPEQAQVFVQAHKPSIVIVDSDQAVLRFVSAKHGALGVIDLYSLTKDVNVLEIDGKLPVEPGYILRGN